MSFMAESINNLERWVGSFPGEHEFSDLNGLEQNPDNLGLAEFQVAADSLITNWHGNKFVGLYLYGTPGTGKTHAAIGLGRALHETGAEVFYKHAPAIQSVRNPATWTGTRYTDIQYEANGVFVDKFISGTERNPKVALIIDDYIPEAQIPLHDAVEAAAQYGGLVIVTSNYTDPFKLVELNDSPKSEQEVVLSAAIEQIAPDAAAKLTEQKEQAAKKISSSLRSRIASGFKLIEFSGEDRRAQNSFWS
jgi:hypothetical protein